MIAKEIKAKNVITKSNLPVCDFSVNTYTGCEHACKYYKTQDSNEQFTSYEAQIDYYTQFIQRHSDWEFVKVYTEI